MKDVEMFLKGNLERKKIWLWEYDDDVEWLRLTTAQTPSLFLKFQSHILDFFPMSTFNYSIFI